MLDVQCETPGVEELLRRAVWEVELPDEEEAFFAKTGVHPTLHDEQRGFVRRHARGRAVLEIRSSLPSLERSPEWRGVYTKDLSRSGIAFYHFRPLFPREQMRLIPPSGKAMIIEVVRCHRVKSNCFEIGARHVERFRSPEESFAPLSEP